MCRVQVFFFKICSGHTYGLLWKAHVPYSAVLYESKKKLLNTQTPILRLRHYPLHLAVESDLYSWPGTRSSAEYCSGVSSLNGDPNLLHKMAEGKGFTRTGPETTTKLLEKGEGFRTKHTGGLNANGDEMVCGLQVRILGLLLLFCLLCHQSRLSGSQGNVRRGQSVGACSILN